MSSFPHDSLAALEAHPSKPSAEATVKVTDFNAAMRLQPPAPAKMPPAEGGAVDAHAAWMAAISGKGPEFLDVIDRRAAAAQWLGQSFVSDEDAARKARVATALAERDARLAAAAADIAVSAEHTAVSDEPTATKPKKGWLR